MKEQSQGYKQTNILLESGTNELEIVEFQVNPPVPGGRAEGDFYGINVAKVREIITMPEITELPRAHKCVEGVFNLRGRVIPLIDLGFWLKNDEVEKESKQRVIVTEFNGIYNGFSVHSVSRIHRISWEQVTSPSEIIEQGESDCIVGVIKFEKKIVMLLDFEKIIADINPSIAIKQTGQHDEDLRSRRKGKRIVIAEDSPFIRKSVIEELSAAGYAVDACSNGRDALETVLNYEKTAKEHGCPLSDVMHCLVTDIEMPQMDGLHLVRRLRDDEFFKDLPIIIFSSIANEENKRKAAGVGATGFIAKPEIPKLVRLIDALVLR